MMIEGEAINYKQFAKGDVVRDFYGKLHVVSEQRGCQVYIEVEPFETLGTWFHPNNLTIVQHAEA